MGQWDTLDWLRDNPGWHRTEEVAKGLTKENGRLFRHTRVLMLLSRSLRYNEVLRRDCPYAQGYEWHTIEVQE